MESEKRNGEKTQMSCWLCSARVEEESLTRVVFLKFDFYTDTWITDFFPPTEYIMKQMFMQRSVTQLCFNVIADTGIWIGIFTLCLLHKREQTNTKNPTEAATQTAHILSKGNTAVISKKH